MRVNGVNGVLGLAGLAAIATATHPLQETCSPSISTVFMTPSPIYVTLTVQQTIASTIYVTVPQVSTVLVGALATSSSSLESATQDTGKAQSSLEYDATVYETAYVTVTLDKPETTAAEEGPLSFVVADGTTSWLGRTPTPGEALVIATSALVITVVPQPPAKPMTTIESTTTIRSTVRTEVTVTVVKTPTHTPSAIVYQGTASFTGKPSGGWNVTSSLPAHNGETRVVAKSSTPTLVLDEPTYNLYPTSTRFSIKISSYAAASGFQPYTTLTPPALSSSPGGSTTAVVNGQTFSWSASATSSQPYEYTIPSEGSTLATSYTPLASSSSVLASVYNSTSSALSTSDAFNTTSVASTPTASSLVLTSSSVSSPSPSSTACGLTGNFVLNFDNIPPLQIGNQSIDDVQPMPVFNPYEKFKFSDGFVVVPPPRVPYLPSSKPLLLEFIPNFTVNVTDEDSGPNSREYGWSGDIGNADQGRTGCFSYNMYGASFGCDSRINPCVFTFSGFQYDRTTKLTNQVTTQSLTVPACPKLENCPLTSVNLDGSFENLDAVRISLKVGGLPKLWWMDDVRLGWFDNTCSVGICRQTTRVR